MILPTCYYLPTCEMSLHELQEAAAATTSCMYQPGNTKKDVKPISFALPKINRHMRCGLECHKFLLPAGPQHHKTFEEPRAVAVVVHPTA